MNVQLAAISETQIDPKLTPRRGRPESREIGHDGRRYKLLPHHDGWRLRSRARGRYIQASFPAMSLSAAKAQALAWLDKQSGKRIKGRDATLAEVVEAYRKIPKKAGIAAEEVNVYRLKAIIQTVLKKPLERVFVSQIGPQTWREYMRLKQGGTRVDLSFAGRSPKNNRINSAIRCALSIFMEKLRPLYEDHGISIPEDIDNVQMLPEMRVPKAPVAKSMLLAWRRLYHVDKALWLTIGLARCAGLRRDEIEHITRAWIVADKSGAVVIDVRDRPEENYAHKTGEAYRAVVLCKRLARELVACKEGLIVRPNLRPGLRKISRHRWFERYPQAWLKDYTGDARQPLHRLRGLYADDVRRRTEALLLAQQAAKKEASKNLGHTGTKTAEKHYFSER